MVKIFPKSFSIFFWILVFQSPLLAQEFPPVFDLATLDGHNGFPINGLISSSRIGQDLGAGYDVNGDGLPDFIFNGLLDTAYLVFGKSAAPRFLDLNDFPGTDGVLITDPAGISNVKLIPDFNEDGFDDILIGVQRLVYDPDEDNFRNRDYIHIVYGSNDIGSEIKLLDFNSEDGLVIASKKADFTGDSNGDGFGDLTICTPGRQVQGECFLLFGGQSSYADTVYYDDIDGSNGVKLINSSENNSMGRDIAAAGDINHDGYDDVIISAPRSVTDSPFPGLVYVIYGKPVFAPSLDLKGISGPDGFTLVGKGGDRLGVIITGDLDLNNDGIDDFVAGAPEADRPGKKFIGQSFVIYGNDQGFPDSLLVTSLNQDIGLVINGVLAGDNAGSVGAAGDVNGDGIDDLLIGAQYAEQTGVTYLVYGSNTSLGDTLELAGLDGLNGFTIPGLTEDSWSGRSVRGSGDLNDDGVDDFLITSFNSSPNGLAVAGKVYVVYGKDGHAKDFEVAPAARDIYAAAFTLVVNWVEKGTVYYGVFPSGVSTPTAEEVVAGSNSEIASGSLPIDMENMEATALVQGLTALTSYDVYVVGEDLNGNLTAPFLLQITTTTITSLSTTPKNQLTAYPNPSRDFLNVPDWNGNNLNNLRIIIKDYLGKDYPVVPAKANQNTLKIDVSGLDPGVYFLMIASYRGSAVYKFFKLP